jgi:hypothetical protein
MQLAQQLADWADRLRHRVQAKVDIGGGCRPGLKPPGCEQRRMNPASHHRKAPERGVVFSKGLQPRSTSRSARLQFDFGVSGLCFLC